MGRGLALGALALMALLMAPASAGAARIYAGHPLDGRAPFQAVARVAGDGSRLQQLTYHAHTNCGGFPVTGYGVVPILPEPSETAPKDHTVGFGGTITGGTFVAGLQRLHLVSDGLFPVGVLGNAVISGRVTRSWAWGRVDATFFVIAAGAILGDCQESFRWHAVRDPGRVYGGATARGEPVAIELTANRRRVRRLAFGWQAWCPGGAWWTATDDRLLDRPWPVSPTGRIHASGHAVHDDATYDERLDGRLGARTARGTLRVDVTTAQDGRCTSGPTRWTAATG